MSRAADLDDVDIGGGGRGKVEKTTSIEKLDERKRAGVRGAVDSLEER